MLHKRNGLYSIDPENDFALTVACFVMQQIGQENTALEDAVIFVPNSRAGQEIQNAFLQESEAKALLLPRILVLGDIGAGDAEDGVLLPDLFLSSDQEQTGDPSSPDLSIPLKVIPRTLEEAKLFSMIMASGPHVLPETPSPAQAWALARELSRLYQEFERYKVTSKDVNALVPDDYAGHWQSSLALLTLILKDYPEWLGRNGFSGPESNLARNLKKYSRLFKAQPERSIFIAGTTGSRPAVSGFMRDMVNHAGCRIILPGLDIDMFDDRWNTLSQQHPQWLLKQLLKTMKKSRNDVSPLGQRDPSMRVCLVRDALAPAPEAAHWYKSNYRTQTSQTLFDGLRTLEADHQRSEAAAIAVALREVLETPGRTGMLVTADRSLAAMVRQHLKRWGITANDAGGTALSSSRPARLMRLILDCSVQSFAPIPFLALLAHPFVRLGYDRSALRHLARLLDRKVFRGPRPAPGLEGLEARLDVLHNGDTGSSGRNALTSKEYQSLKGLLKVLSQWYQLLQHNKACPRDHLISHIKAVEALVQEPVYPASSLGAFFDQGNPGAGPADADQGLKDIWGRDEGKALKHFLVQLLEGLTTDQSITAKEYPALFDTWLTGQQWVQSQGQHPRLHIVGPLEIRSKSADLVILAGLNEDSWPKTSTPDPWLNRQMRQQLGLPSPDVRIGQAAHDFTTGIGAPACLLTRSLKTTGSPTVKSRWLYRIEALAGQPLPVASELLAFSALLDKNLVEEREKSSQSHAGRDLRLFPADPPRPKPPLKSRPTSFSVSDVQSWMCDPYSLYAKRILKLRVLDPLDADPGASDKGVLLHECLEAFLKSGGPFEGQQGLKLLLDIGCEKFKGLETLPAVKAFWWPRFVNLADAFIRHGEEWRQNHTTQVLEAFGRVSLAGLPDYDLYAKADRIDLDQSGGAVIIDYKTGQHPSAREILYGYAPQLPLESLIVSGGGFETLGTVSVVGLEYWMTKGGSKPLETKNITSLTKKEIVELTTQAEKGLIGMIKAFRVEQTPYLSNPRSSVTGYGEYDALARVKEWRGRPDRKEQGLEPHTHTDNPSVAGKDI